MFNFDWTVWTEHFCKWGYPPWSVLQPRKNHSLPTGGSHLTSRFSSETVKNSSTLYLLVLQAEAGCLSIGAELPRCASLVIFSSSCSFSPVQKLARMLFVFSPAPLAIPVCPVCLTVEPLTLEYCCQIITNNPRSIWRQTFVHCSETFLILFFWFETNVYFWPN